ncbi:type II 3-dehydroquinate dehydratase [Eubacteriales bacterium OttesenSCG-928-G02]|nr:type II 3-dehydroquinate dehydratase [Eubacteriales bacterium OttesenSCG-928-G02]
MKILVINGPNLNLLGIREPDLYGKSTYNDLCNLINTTCIKNNVQCEIFQSNHEGEIIDKIQNAYNNFNSIIINPAAYTHTSIAIADALKAVNLPTVEVHITNINRREEYRKISYIREFCEKTFAGYGFDSYKMAILYLCSKI